MALSQDRGGGVGDALSGDVRGRAVDGLEHGRCGASGIDVAAGSQADAAGDGAGEVGDDVAEEVVRDDDVEPCRIHGHVDGRGVDVHVVDLDLRELLGDRIHRALVEAPGVDQHIVLVHERQLVPGPLCRQLEA